MWDTVRSMFDHSPHKKGDFVKYIGMYGSLDETGLILEVHYIDMKQPGTGAIHVEINYTVLVGDKKKVWWDGEIVLQNP